MNKPQVTPSPWNLDTRTGEIYAGREATRYCLGFIAQPHLALHQSNAQAIAALPDLLAALEAMLEAYAPFHQQSVEHKGGEDGLHSSVRAARAALKKAGYTFP
jgi:hypothetical protein